MDLVRHVECFVAVAEESHFGRAAARLGMAQPPLSQRIQRLEKELGVRLFDRSSRQVAVTEAGALLLADARDMLARAEALRATARRIRHGETGLLRAALPPDLAGETVAALLADFGHRHPGLVLEVHELTTAQQLARFAAHELDVGVIHHPCDVTGLEVGEILRSELGVLLPGGAEAAARDEVPLSLLDGYDLILFPRSCAPASYDDLLTMCARNGYTPAAVRHGQGAGFVRGLILSAWAARATEGSGGAGAVAFAPRDAVAAAAPPAEPGPAPDRSGASGASGVVWRPLAGAPLALRHSAAWPRGRADAAVRAFGEAAARALRATAGATADEPGRRTHLRPASEFWL